MNIYYFDLIYACLLLFIIFRILWRRYAVDRFREKLFGLRDVLFDLALKKKNLNFESEQYQKIEDIINKTIRYAHNISLLDIIIFRILLKKRNIDIESYETNYIKEISRLINKLNDDLIKKELEDIMNKYERAIIEYISIRSILFAITIISTAILIFIYTIIKKKLLRGYNNEKPLNTVKRIIKNNFRKPVNDIEYQALSAA